MTISLYLSGTYWSVNDEGFYSLKKRSVDEQIELGIYSEGSGGVLSAEIENGMLSSGIIISDDHIFVGDPLDPNNPITVTPYLPNAISINGPEEVIPIDDSKEWYILRIGEHNLNPRTGEIQDIAFLVSTDRRKLLIQILNNFKNDPRIPSRYQMSLIKDKEPGQLVRMYPTRVTGKREDGFNNRSVSNPQEPYITLVQNLYYRVGEVLSFARFQNNPYYQSTDDIQGTSGTPALLTIGDYRLPGLFQGGSYGSSDSSYDNAAYYALPITNFLDKDSIQDFINSAEQLLYQIQDQDNQV
jgi:hypothetical protein